MRSENALSALLTIEFRPMFHIAPIFVRRQLLCSAHDVIIGEALLHEALEPVSDALEAAE
jgi:hypothetical protein